MAPTPRSNGSPSSRRFNTSTNAKARHREAWRPGARSSTVWSQAEREKLGLVDDDGKQGRAISLPEPEPWPTPIDGVALLDGIAEAIGRYVVMSEHARACRGLVGRSYLLTGLFRITPRLAVRSPMKRCGKTTLLDVISRLVLRPLPTGSVTAAALFRVVEGYRPTLLVDEADTFLSEADELRGVLNSGHRKGGQVVRTVRRGPRAPRVLYLRGRHYRHHRQPARHPGGPLGYRRSQAAHAEREGRVIPLRSRWPSGRAGSPGGALGAGPRRHHLRGRSRDAGHPQPGSRQLGSIARHRRRSRRGMA